MPPTTANYQQQKNVRPSIDEMFDPEYRKVRQSFQNYIKQIQNVGGGIYSKEQIEQQQRWIESIIGDSSAIQEAIESYEGPVAMLKIREIEKFYQRDFIKPLDDALEMGAISADSYQKWIDWVKDGNRSSDEKKSSIKEELPKYLKPRIALAEDRNKLLKDDRLKDPKEIKDPALRERILTLQDGRLYFDTLEFTQRRNLVDTISASLTTIEGGGEYQKLFDDAKDILMEATKEPQPALHRDKVGTWLKRIFESGASFEEMTAFVHGQKQDSLHSLIKRWREKAIDFWKLRDDLAFKGVKIDFINTKKFLEMHYNDRVAYVRKMMEDRNRARELRSRAMARIAQSGSALGSGAKERWLKEYVFNEELTLDELQDIISGELSTRLENKVAILREYKDLIKEGNAIHAFRGKQVKSQSAFLKLHYNKQVQEVKELKERIAEVQENKPDLIEIRHLMDRKDWKEAHELIQEAKKNPHLTQADKEKISSMERRVLEHIGEDGEETDEDKEMLELFEEVDDQIDSSSPEYQTMCRVLCDRGSKAIGALSWASYNRQWCNEHGYLDYKREVAAVKRGEHEARLKQRSKRRGVYSETIKGETSEEEYIELSRTAPTNVCVDLSDASAKSAFTESMWHNRNDPRALYWTNAIFHHGGTPVGRSEQQMATDKMYKMRNALRKVESKGGVYRYKNAAKELKQPGLN